MACDFCNEKTVITSGDFKMEMDCELLHVAHECSEAWYNSDAFMKINNCPMCGRDLRGDNHD